MKKLNTFFYVFKNSVTSFAYYKDILDTSFSFSIKYLAVLAFLAAVVTSSIISYRVVPKITKYVYEQKDIAIRIFPDDLELSASNGKWSINKPQPYAIKTPEEYRKDGDTSFPANLIVFDEKGTLNDYASRDTFILVNQNNIITITNGKLEAQPIKDLQDGKINKANYTAAINEIDKFTKYIPIIFGLFVFAGMYFYYFVFKLFYLLFVALVLLIVNMFVKPDVGFKDLYRIGLHSMTVPLIIEVAVISSGITDSTGIPWFFIINIVIGTLVMVKAIKMD